MSDYVKIPEDEQDNIMHLYWLMLQELESIGHDDDNSVFARNTVEAGYTVFNRINATRNRPRWEDTVTQFQKLMDIDIEQQGDWTPQNIDAFLATKSFDASPSVLEQEAKHEAGETFNIVYMFYDETSITVEVEHGAIVGFKTSAGYKS
jgi:hypothetical protein